MHDRSSRMAADIYTKAFVNPESWHKALNNINHFDPSHGLSKCISERVRTVHARALPIGISDDSTTGSGADSGAKSTGKKKSSREAESDESERESARKKKKKQDDDSDDDDDRALDALDFLNRKIQTNVGQ